MTKLAYLHEPGVLSNLKSRYDINEIYVSSESFLTPGLLAKGICSDISSTKVDVVEAN